MCLTYLTCLVIGRVVVEGGIGRALGTETESWVIGFVPETVRKVGRLRQVPAIAQLFGARNQSRVGHHAEKVGRPVGHYRN